MDIQWVELQFQNGDKISMDYTVVENKVADNPFASRTLDNLIYNDPVAYAALVLNGNPKKYLKAVTIYRNTP